MKIFRNSLLFLCVVCSPFLVRSQCATDQIIIYDTDICTGFTANISVTNTEIGVRYLLRDSNNCQMGDTILGTGMPINFTSPVLSQSNNYSVIGNIPGDYHKGLNFDGVDDYVDMGNQPQLDFTNTTAFTIESWIKVAVNPPTNFSQIMSKTDNAAGNTGWGLQMNGGFPEFYLMNDFGAANYLFINETNIDLRDNIWHHVAVSYDGSSDSLGVVFYIDGVKSTTKSNANTLTGGFTNIGDFHIGNYRGGGNFYHFKGAIDEVRIWNGVKTQKQICTDMRTYLNGAEPNLIAFWNFNEGIATTANDLSANNLSGSLTNMLATNWITGAIDSVCTVTMSTQPVIIVLPPYSGSATVSICNGDSVLIGGIYRKLPGVFVDNLTSQFGCDSTVTKTLSLNNNYFIEDSIFICSNDSILLFGVYQNTAGFYYDSLQTVVTGCDSIFKTKLIVNPFFSSSSNAAICMGDSLLVFGNYKKVAGTYYDSLQTIFGCDSITILHLTINNLPNATIDTIILVQGSQFCNSNGVGFYNLTATHFGGTFSGVGVAGDSLDLSVITPGVTWVFYTIIDSNLCTGLDSNSLAIPICSSIEELTSKNNLKIYPNPTPNNVTLDLSDFDRDLLTVKLFDLMGKKVKNIQVFGGQTLHINLNKLARGIYQITVQSKNKFSSGKLVLK